MSQTFASIITSEAGLKSWQVEQTITLLKEGATIPFISRYRKEMTGSLDEMQVSFIRDRLHKLEELEKRREAVIASIEEQEKMTDVLMEAIKAARTLSELEDIYLPYRPKRRTRASMAREKGLEPLAKWLMRQEPGDPLQKALAYVSEEKGVLTTEDALAGARDIIAEWVSEHARARAGLRSLFERESGISCRVIKGKETEGNKYATYFDWSEPLRRTPSHRLLAMLRGEKEGFLRVSVSPDSDDAIHMLERLFVKGTLPSSELVMEAVEDAWKRLLQPSLETEMRGKAKEKADEEAIRVFAENLRQLLLSPPLGQKRMLAIDPGFRTGCKVVCLDSQGRLLHNETIYPHPPQQQLRQAASKIKSLVSAYDIEAIAIGNGTAGRETETLVRSIRFDKDIMAVMVNESGASVYSASAVAREEFPDYDVTVRGAVSIGRRLADPLAELVKIDPKSIGVGQYQHDVDQKMLKQSLDDVVMSCVNAVGVEVNTASKELLTYVSGLGPALAAAVVAHRNENGPFGNRKELMKVARFGAKAFEQAAGFLRVNESDNPLDRSAVHPESYYVVERMAGDLGVKVADLMKDKSLQKQIKLQDYVNEKTGLPTLQDIMQELARPGRDPREQFDLFAFDKRVNSMADLREGMILPGIITNITAFGAFVDIGVHQDGLVHISQLSNTFVSDPAQVVKLNQKVQVKVLQLDLERKRIQLSMKEVND